MSTLENFIFCPAQR